MRVGQKQVVSMAICHLLPFSLDNTTPNQNAPQLCV